VVHIDLDGMTFAGCSLINFVFRLACQVSGHAAVNRCRPPSMAHQLIELTGVAGVAAVRHDLPADWIALWASTQVPDAVTTVVPA
jgi:hypothetical protein